MAPPLLVDEDVDGLRVGEDLLRVGHDVHILGGQENVSAATRIISGPAWLLLFICVKK